MTFINTNAVAQMTESATPERRRTSGCYADPAAPTLNSQLSDADLCRANGWGPGTIIEGDEGYGIDRVLITAVGERKVIGRKLDRTPSYEGMWCLRWRDWREPKEA